ncbi:putative serine/threonine-protein kinase [Tetrabaena socialis]|uniref:Putative serine/threonine-protein kinase n=1 Tax=Tetrabaena socialis TaxID=47790 RepID=A0A2J7ZU25_9CHLO|nr:putative serine/threonine-protein kinase [Tetrabaena socialis]|eukprot:PNH03748.1 putative serine/threonine-protein kinase [Tetrabaena socialis]
MLGASPRMSPRQSLSAAATDTPAPQARELTDAGVPIAIDLHYRTGGIDDAGTPATRTHSSPFCTRGPTEDTADVPVFSTNPSFTSALGFPYSSHERGFPTTDDEQTRLQALRSLDLLNTASFNSGGQRCKLDDEVELLLGTVMEVFHAKAAVLVLLEENNVIVRNSEAIDGRLLCTEFSHERGQPHLPTILLTALEVASAMQCLHSRGYMHGDLSAVNVLLADSPEAPPNPDATAAARGPGGAGPAADPHPPATGGVFARLAASRRWVAKVSDFGLTRHVPNPNEAHVSATYGVVTHCAPEVLRSHTQTQHQQDLFSRTTVAMSTGNCSDFKDVLHDSPASRSCGASSKSVQLPVNAASDVRLKQSCWCCVSSIKDIALQSQDQPKADSYSFGVLLWQMYTGSRPWANMNRFQIMRAVTSAGAVGLRFLPHQQPPPRYLELATRCLSPDPDERPTFAEICQELRLAMLELEAAA